MRVEGPSVERETRRGTNVGKNGRSPSGSKGEWHSVGPVAGGSSVGEALLGIVVDLSRTDCRR